MAAFLTPRTEKREVFNKGVFFGARHGPNPVGKAAAAGSPIIGVGHLRRRVTRHLHRRHVRNAVKLAELVQQVWRGLLDLVSFELAKIGIRYAGLLLYGAQRQSRRFARPAKEASKCVDGTVGQVLGISSSR